MTTSAASISSNKNKKKYTINPTKIANIKKGVASLEKVGLKGRNIVRRWAKMRGQVNIGRVVL